MGGFLLPSARASLRIPSNFLDILGNAQNACTSRMLANTSSANLSALVQVAISLFSMPESMATHIDTTIKIAGTMQSVMSVSFHWAANATANEAKNVVVAWTVRPNFSEMPWWTRLPPVVMLLAIEPRSDESKWEISWRRVCLRKVRRRVRVIRMAFMATIV